MSKFLPMTMKEMKNLGWEKPDFVFVTGDAYVDHSSFGSGLLCRLLESRGYQVAVISQPDWRDKNSVMTFGEPRLGFLLTSGNMDSMVNHYTSAKKKRTSDAYTPGGEMGKRPDYALVVYGNLIRQAYKFAAIIIGGLEASLRRLAHYDYWSDKVKRSVLLDAAADLLIYGMGEKALLEIAEALQSGLEIKDLTYVKGTVYKTKAYVTFAGEEVVDLPAFSIVKEDKQAFAKSFMSQYKHTDPFYGRTLVEAYTDHLYVVQNPPSPPLNQQEMDDIYDLDYTRMSHPFHEKAGKVAALEEVQFSLTSSRGCFGGCSFCALTFHQGRIVQSRSHASLVKEAEKMVSDPDFKGYIHDVGGPTANFRRPACKKQLSKGACPNKHCLAPKPCPHLEVDHRDYVELLRKLRNIKGVKKVFIRSGIRFDYVNLDKDQTFLKELIAYHISGQLRLAPEHVSSHVLALMHKPDHTAYETFLKSFQNIEEKRLGGKEKTAVGGRQYVLPYFISSHPGSTLEDGVHLAEYCRDLGFNPEQIQDFYPTPGNLSTCMYYTGINPQTLEEVYVAKSPKEKALQRALIQYRLPQNHKLVLEALKKAKREDLIGFGSSCLIGPRVFKKDREKRKERRGTEKEKRNRTVQRKKHGKESVETKKFTKGIRKDARNPSKGKSSRTKAK